MEVLPRLFNQQTSFNERVNLLDILWKNVALNVHQNDEDYTGNLLCWALRHTMHTIVESGWKKVSETELVSIKKHVAKTLEGVPKSCFAYERCQLILDNIDNPWGTESFRQVINGDSDEVTDSDIEFFTYERGCMIVLRLRKLIQIKCYSAALTFSSKAVKAYKSIDENHSLRKSTSLAQYSYIADTFLVLLLKYGNLTEIVEEVKILSPKQALNAIQRNVKMSGNVTYTSKYHLRIACLIAEIILAKFMQDDIDENNEIEYCEILREWFMLHENTDVPEFRTIVGKLFTTAKSKYHIYLACSMLKDMHIDTWQIVLIELFVRALTADLNELELLKSERDCDEHTMINHETELSYRYLYLADILKDSLPMAKECILTAFSLNPSPENYERVIAIARVTGKINEIDDNINLINNKENRIMTDNEDQLLTDWENRIIPETSTTICDNGSEVIVPVENNITSDYTITDELKKCCTTNIDLNSIRLNGHSELELINTNISPPKPMNIDGVVVVDNENNPVDDDVEPNLDIFFNDINKDDFLTAEETDNIRDFFQRIDEALSQTNVNDEQSIVAQDKNIDIAFGNNAISDTNVLESYIENNLIESTTNTNIDALHSITNCNLPHLPNYDELTAPSLIDTIDLPSEIHTDLLVLLQSPRVKLLSWVLPWTELERNCKRMLQKEVKLTLIRRTLAGANDYLQYLNLDYEQFKHLPEIEYPGIEKGYEIYSSDDNDDDDDLIDKDMDTDDSDVSSSYDDLPKRRKYKRNTKKIKSTKSYEDETDADDDRSNKSSACHSEKYEITSDIPSSVSSPSPLHNKIDASTITDLQMRQIDLNEQLSLQIAKQNYYKQIRLHSNLHDHRYAQNSYEQNDISDKSILSDESDVLSFDKLISSKHDNSIENERYKTEDMYNDRTNQWINDNILMQNRKVDASTVTHINMRQKVKKSLMKRNKRSLYSLQREHSYFNDTNSISLDVNEQEIIEISKNKSIELLRRATKYIREENILPNVVFVNDENDSELNTIKRHEKLMKNKIKTTLEHYSKSVAKDYRKRQMKLKRERKKSFIDSSSSSSSSTDSSPETYEYELCDNVAKYYSFRSLKSLTNHSTANDSSNENEFDNNRMKDDRNKLRSYRPAAKNKRCQFNNNSMNINTKYDKLNLECHIAEVIGEVTKLLSDNSNNPDNNDDDRLYNSNLDQDDHLENVAEIPESILKSNLPSIRINHNGESNCVSQNESDNDIDNMIIYDDVFDNINHSEILVNDSHQLTNYESIGQINIDFNEPLKYSDTTLDLLTDQDCWNDDTNLITDDCKSIELFVDPDNDVLSSQHNALGIDDDESFIVQKPIKTYSRAIGLSNKIKTISSSSSSSCGEQQTALCNLKIFNQNDNDDESIWKDELIDMVLDMEEDRWLNSTNTGMANEARNYYSESEPTSSSSLHPVKDENKVTSNQVNYEQNPVDDPKLTTSLVLLRRCSVGKDFQTNNNTTSDTESSDNISIENKISEEQHEEINNECSASVMEAKVVDKIVIKKLKSKNTFVTMSAAANRLQKSSQLSSSSSSCSSDDIFLNEIQRDTKSHQSNTVANDNDKLLQLQPRVVLHKLSYQTLLEYNQHVEIDGNIIRQPEIRLKRLHPSEYELNKRRRYKNRSCRYPLRNRYSTTSKRKYVKRSTKKKIRKNVYRNNKKRNLIENIPEIWNSKMNSSKDHVRYKKVKPLLAHNATSKTSNRRQKINNLEMFQISSDDDGDIDFDKKIMKIPIIDLTKSPITSSDSSFYSDDSNQNLQSSIINRSYVDDGNIYNLTNGRRKILTRRNTTIFETNDICRPFMLSHNNRNTRDRSYLTRRNSTADSLQISLVNLSNNNDVSSSSSNSYATRLRNRRQMDMSNDNTTNGFNKYKRSNFMFDIYSVIIKSNFKQFDQLLFNTDDLRKKSLVENCFNNTNLMASKCMNVNKSGNIRNELLFKKNNNDKDNLDIDNVYASKKLNTIDLLLRITSKIRDRLLYEEHNDNDNDNDKLKRYVRLKQTLSNFFNFWLPQIWLKCCTEELTSIDIIKKIHLKNKELNMKDNSVKCHNDNVICTRKRNQCTNSSSYLPGFNTWEHFTPPSYHFFTTIGIVRIVRTSSSTSSSSLASSTSSSSSSLSSLSSPSSSKSTSLNEDKNDHVTQQETKDENPKVNATQQVGVTQSSNKLFVSTSQNLNRNIIIDGKTLKNTIIPLQLIYKSDNNNYNKNISETFVIQKQTVPVQNNSDGNYKNSIKLIPQNFILTDNDIITKSNVDTSSSASSSIQLTLPLVTTANIGQSKRITFNSDKLRSMNDAKQVDNSTLEQLREFDLVLEQVKERSTTKTQTDIHNLPKLRVITEPIRTIKCTPIAKLVSTNNNSIQSNQINVINHSVTKQIPTISLVTRRDRKDDHKNNVEESVSNNVLYHKLNLALLQKAPLVVVANSIGKRTVLSNDHDSTPTVITENVEKKFDESNHNPQMKISSKSTYVKQKNLSKVLTTTSSNNIQQQLQQCSQKITKPQEDEQTVQRIYDILAEYAEQLRNSPDLNNKPAPRRRSNPVNHNVNTSNTKKRKVTLLKPSEMNETTTDSEQINDSEDSSCATTSSSMCNRSPFHETLSSSNDCGFVNLKNSSPPYRATGQVKTISITSSSSSSSSSSKRKNIEIIDADKTGNKNTVLIPTKYFVPLNIIKTESVQDKSTTSDNVKKPKFNDLQNTVNESIEDLNHLSNKITYATRRNLMSTTGFIPSKEIKIIEFAAPVKTESVAFNNDRLLNATSVIKTNDYVKNNNCIVVRKADKTTDSISSSFLLNFNDFMNENMQIVPPQLDYHGQSKEDVILSRMTPQLDEIDIENCHVAMSPKSNETSSQSSMIKTYTVKKINSNENHNIIKQSTISDDCQDLGVDEPSTSELFPEAELFFDVHSSSVCQYEDNEIIKKSSSANVNDDIDVMTNHFNWIDGTCSDKDNVKISVKRSSALPHKRCANVIFSSTKNSGSSSQMRDIKDNSVIVECKPKV